MSGRLSTIGTTSSTLAATPTKSAVTKRQTSPVPGAGPATQAPIPINVLLGIPDDHCALVQVVDEAKRIEFTLPGTANIGPYLSPRRFAAHALFLQPGRPIPIRLVPGPLVNDVGDADISAGALGLVKQIAEQTARPCFNHPTEILRATRDEISRLLAGIPGLAVPRTIRIRETFPSEVRETVHAAGLAYPILIRVAGSHGTENMIRIETPEAMDRIAQLEREERPLYASEFRDFAGPDGMYRKFRIAVVGDEIFLRDFVVGKDWLLGEPRRIAAGEQEEHAQRASFDRDRAPRLLPLFREIGRRLGLDFFGVDCSIDRDGQVLLFEASAAMPMLKKTPPSPNMWDESVARITGAVERLLAVPQKWRQFPRTLKIERMS